MNKNAIVIFHLCLFLIAFQSGFSQNVNDKNKSSESKKAKECNGPVTLDKETYYHATSPEIGGIKSNELNNSWVKIFIFKPDNIQIFQSELFSNDLKVSLTKDFNNDGLIDTIITGTFIDTNNNEHWQKGEHY